MTTSTPDETLELGPADRPGSAGDASNSAPHGAARDEVPLGSSGLLKLLRGVLADRSTGLLHASKGAGGCCLAFIGGELVDVDPGARDPGAAPTAEAIRSALDALCGWREAACSFEARDPASVEDPRVAGAPSTAQLILDVVRALDDGSVVADLGDLHRPLRLAPDSLAGSRKLTLTSTDGYILSRVDGSSSASEILELTPLPVPEVLRSLLGLISTGILETVSASAAGEPARGRAIRQAILDAHAGLAGKDDWQVLGIPRFATPEQVRDAYRVAVRRFHPDALSEPWLADARGPAAVVFERVSRAYEALNKIQAAAATSAADAAVRTAPAPETPEPEPASVLDTLKAAETALAEGRALDALAPLQRVLPLAQGTVKARVQVLLARAYMPFPDRARQAEELLLTTTREHPAHADAYFALGDFYRRRGMTARARAQFEKVLEIRPGDPPTVAELARLMPGSESGGLLKRLLAAGSARLERA